MAVFTLNDIPDELLARARQRATDRQESLGSVLREALLVYVGNGERQRFAAKGGRARAQNLSPEERSESARKAVQARWRKEKK